MVVTRKTPVAPVPLGSRTNSAHAVPRAAKAKPPPSALAESETRDSIANATPTPKPPSKSKNKNKHHKKPIKQPTWGFLDYLLYLTLSLFAVYAFATCPYDQNHSNAVCRSLSQYRVHVLEPFVLPPIRHALAHPAVAPYVHQAEKFERQSIRPVVLKTAEITAPYAAAAKHTVWDRILVPQFKAHVVPLYARHILPIYRRHILPSYNTYVAPYFSEASPYIKHTQRRLQQGGILLHVAYTDYVAPAARSTYAFSKPWAIKVYRATRPHALALAAHGKALALLAADKAGEARRMYVDPHVVRIWDKVLELSGVEPATPAAKVAEPKPQASAGTGLAEEPTPVPETTTEAVETAVTPVETTVAEATAKPSAEETVSIVATTSSTVSTETIEALSAAASIAADSAHGMESLVVESILSDAISTGTASPSVTAVPVETAEAEVETQTETKTKEEEVSSAASVAVQSAHGRESPVVDAMKAAVDDNTGYDDFLADIGIEDAPPIASPSSQAEDAEDNDSSYDDFLADIGIVNDDKPASTSTPADASATPLTDEEKERITAEKRANLMARLADSLAAMEALAKEKTKELRKMLVGMRKKGVATLNDPATPVGGAVGALRTEGEKYFKGLEAYLKKGGEGEGEARMERWEKVAQRVEEKLQKGIIQAQTKLREFHAQEKEGEGEEGMKIIQQVKDACAREQGGIGLELSWLADVTYHDWQRYHDVARVGEKFHKEASDIQAGTHAHPPVDPFMVRMGEVQAELATLVGALNDRLNGFKTRAREAFVGDGDDDESAEEEETETAEPGPQVSILPIDPSEEPLPIDPSEEPEKVDPPPHKDPATVVIGKDQVQVLEALKNVPVESQVHEEL